MSDTNRIIKDIQLSKRINNSPSTLTITFNTPLAPTEFSAGMPIEFILNDGIQSNEIIVFTGILEKIHRNETDNRIYAVTGRDEGRLLTRQPFIFDCEETSTRKYTYNDVLREILADTDLKIGRGLIAIDGDV